MKYAFTLAAMLVASVAGTSFAGEGQVSDAQLAEMGLPGIQVMSDAQGSEIRGQGFAYASSKSYSRLPGTSTRDKASALGFHHASVGSGAESYFEVDFLIGGRHGPRFSLQLKAAVGSHGYAYANAY